MKFDSKVMDPGFVYALQSMKKVMNEMATQIKTIVGLQKPSYKEIAKQKSAPKPKEMMNHAGHVTDPVCKKITDIRHTSSSSPIYFKCSELGHLAFVCRNGTLCFACHGIVHRSFQCPDR
jgi:hypothetical protein